MNKQIKDLSVFSLRDSRRIEKEIVERFPSESLDYYRTSSRGRINKKFSNNKKLFRQSPRGSRNSEEVSKPLLDSEQKAEDIARSIKFDNLSAEDFDRFWQACNKYRLNEIKGCASTSDALEKLPAYYKKPLGYRLIDMNFKVLHSSANPLLDTWQRTRTLKKGAPTIYL